MTNRINPGIPPSRRPGARTATGPSPLDAVRKISAALKEVIRQQSLIATGTEKMASFDLMTIWRAAKNDPGNQGAKGDREHLTPRQYVEDYDHLIKALDQGQKNKVLVDATAAFGYVALVDARVEMARNDHMMQQQAKEIGEDPIQAGVDACKAGPFGLFFVAIRATAVTYQSPEAYFEAVLDRAKEQAGEMEEVAGETLLSDVLKAIAGCPSLDGVMRLDPDA